MEVGAVKIEEEKLDSQTVVEVKLKPENYQEIYKNYKDKNYKHCLELLNNVSEQHTEYQILKSACMIHSGEKVSEAHKILDEVIAGNPDNEFTIYAKGLAYYHEEKWEESIEYFNKARNMNQTADMERAEILMEKAREKLKQSKSTSSSSSSAASEPFRNFKRSPGSANIIRRFGCDLCNHFFGKKFNLDRHNRTIHKRDTPLDFPTNPKYKSGATVTRATTPVVVKLKEEPKARAKSEESTYTPPPQIIRKGKIKCNVCKKFFKRSSIARHSVIHTGNKPVSKNLLKLLQKDFNQFLTFSA